MAALRWDRGWGEICDHGNGEWGGGVGVGEVKGRSLKEEMRMQLPVPEGKEEGSCISDVRGRS